MVSAGPAGSAPRVDATYDRRYFALEQRPATETGGPATWNIWFRRVHGSGPAMHWLQQIVGATRPEIRLQLPEDLPLALHGNFAGGLVQADLGGLQITELEIELSGGGLSIDFSEVASPMERFCVDARQAGLKLINLGNASPREIEIDAVMGTVEIDLRGEWRRDAEIDLETKMARGTLRLPRNVEVEGLELTGLAMTDAEIPRPTLRFNIDETMGSLKIER